MKIYQAKCKHTENESITTCPSRSLDTLPVLLKKFYFLNVHIFLYSEFNNMCAFENPKKWLDILKSLV